MRLLRPVRGAGYKLDLIFCQWTVGPVYYLALAQGETLDPRSKSQVADLRLNGGSDMYMPGYYIAGDARSCSSTTSQTRRQANAIQINVVELNLRSVQVGYLMVDTLAQAGNIICAGQTFGSPLFSDGRHEGGLDATTLQRVAWS